MNTLSLLAWIDESVPGRGIYFADEDSTKPWASVSYAELADEVLRAASLLEGLGVIRNEVVCILASEPRDFLPAFYGTLTAGGTPSPLATPLTFRSFELYIAHLAEVLRTATPAVVCTEPNLADTVRRAVRLSGISTIVLEFSAVDLVHQPRGVRRPAAELALLQFTSGSSGTPKGVEVTAENLDNNLLSIASSLNVQPDDTVVSWLPHYHDMGLIGSLLTNIALGIDIRLLTPAQFVRSPLRWLEAMGRDGGTLTVAPSFGYSYTARRVRSAQLDGLDFSQWRVAIIAAERTDPVGINAFCELVQPHGFSKKSLISGYGLAEATLGVTNTRSGNGDRIRLVQLEQHALRDGEAVIVSDEVSLGDRISPGGNWIAGCGTPLDGVDLRIVTEEGAVLPEGFHGQIEVYGTGVARGYKTTPHAATSTSFGDGVLRTGDAGFVLDGQLYVIGRMGDSIKVRGVKLYAEDLDVKIGAATGMNSGRYAAILGTVGATDVVVAIVESADSPWLSALQSALQSMTADNIAVAIFRGEPGTIERTSSGKPRRRILWRRLMDGDLPVEEVYTNWSSIITSDIPWTVGVTPNSTPPN